MVVDGGGGAAAEFLEFLGEFAGDADELIRGDAGEEFEGAVDAVGAFEEDGGFGAGDGGGEGTFALAAFDWEEAAEHEGVGGEAAADEGGEDGAGAGDDLDAEVGAAAGARGYCAVTAWSLSTSAIAAARFSDARSSSQNWDASPRAMWSFEPSRALRSVLARRKRKHTDNKDERLQRTQLC